MGSHRTCGGQGFRNRQAFDESWSGVAFKRGADDKGRFAPCEDADGPAWKIKLPERAKYRVEMWFHSQAKLDLAAACYAIADGERKSFAERGAQVEYFQDDEHPE